MPVRVHVEEIEMEDHKDSVLENRSSNSISSIDSSESEKGPPKNISDDNDDTIGSGSSFQFRAYASDASTLRNSTAALITPIQSISKDVPMYPSLNRNTDNKQQREYTPANSLCSIDDIAMEMTEEETKKLTRNNMAIIYSCIYGILLTITGGVIYINHQSPESRFISEIFSICNAIVGMAWLIFLHLDLYRYKRQIVKNMIFTTEDVEKISPGTDLNMTGTFIGNEAPPYRFLRGRHSGSFYLKTGLAAFCFGHLVKEGLLLGQEVVNYVQEDRYALGCGDISSLVQHIIRPLYSFYQLFMVFKYSNVIINRYKILSCFALMHIMATCLCFWFGTIVEDALEDYHHKLGQKESIPQNNTLQNETHLMTPDYAICSHLANVSQCTCSSTAILSLKSVQAIPYLYPFTIEFNILLAGVWFLIWHNIGKENSRANPHHFQHKISRKDGIEEVTYQSNLVISADCHASNKGLFAGLFLLMTSIISIIIFFVAMSIERYQQVALSIYCFQEGTLTTLALGGVLVGYKQLSKLDFNLHPITFLDDVLLFVPLPFFFVQALLTVISECHRGSFVRIFLAILVPVQVILQTPFIIDGLRRCSNSQSLRYKKPGREIVTFLIVCNLTMWIINTFEEKSVESHYGQQAYFGEFLWMFVSHTTLPLMLFYRFHSSACLADIWKSAYDKGEK